LHIHEPKENNRGAEASSLSMGTCGSTAMNTHGGFTPAAVASPKNAIDPELVLRHHRSAQGRYGGTGTVPSFIIPVLRISYHSKNSSTEPFFQDFLPHSQFLKIHRKRFNPKDSLIPKMRLLRQMCGNRGKRISNQKYWYFSGTTGCQHHFFIMNRASENILQPYGGDDSAFLPHGVLLYRDRFPG
jgi:hypothetical protein